MSALSAEIKQSSESEIYFNILISKVELVTHWYALGPVSNQMDEFTGLQSDVDCAKIRWYFIVVNPDEYFGKQ